LGKQASKKTESGFAIGAIPKLLSLYRKIPQDGLQMEVLEGMVFKKNKSLCFELSKYIALANYDIINWYHEK
jgi:hypothetical protein